MEQPSLFDDAVCPTCGDTGWVIERRPCGCKADVAVDADGAYMGADHGAPETQKEAALTVETGNDRWMVLKAITERPASDDELSYRLGRQLNTVRPRRWELQTKLVMIEDSGIRRVTRVGKKRAAVWQVNARGIEYWLAHPDGGPSDIVRIGGST